MSGPPQNNRPIGHTNQMTAEGFCGVSFRGGELAQVLGIIDDRIEPGNGAVGDLFEALGELLDIEGHQLAATGW